MCGFSSQSLALSHWDIDVNRRQRMRHVVVLFSVIQSQLQYMGSSFFMQDLCCKVSVVVGHRLSCPMACRILVSQPGIEPTSSALQDRFLTTGPPGKSWEFQLSLLRNRRENQGGLLFLTCL